MDAWGEPRLPSIKGHSLFAGLAALLLLAGCHSSIDPATSRLSIKHGLDPGASKIDMTAKPMTIDDLANMKLPDNLQGNLEDYQNQRVGDFENQVWSVQATIKSIQLRKDGDYYMDIEGADGKRSVVEVPDPKLCKGSPLEPQIASTRKALDDKYHPTTTKQEENDPASLQGVGFYGWRGRPTGGRLMPGLSVSFGSGSKAAPKGKS